MGYLERLLVVAIWLMIVLFIVLYKDLRKNIIFLFNFKIKKLKMKHIVITFLVFVVVFFSGRMIKDGIENIKYLKEEKDTKALEEYDKNMEFASSQINKYYEIIEEVKTDIEKCKKPYIPDGFKYVEGEWNSGYVIEDENKNQFVWIPCSNTENSDNIPILSREVFSKNSVPYYSCIEEYDIEEFLKSSLENGGFYISRYEIGKENEKPVSKAECEIYTNITCNEAKELSKNMYKNINSRLINGYSFDTAVKFIKDEIDMNNISKSTGKTGTKSYKNIYDLVDDLGEWTEEKRNKSQIYRKTVISTDDKYLVDRLSQNEEYSDENIGFRTIIYK